MTALVPGILMTSVCRMMPASMRKNAVSKDNAPNPAKLRRDLHDEFGETPYKTEEVVPGKVDIYYLCFIAVKLPPCLHPGVVGDLHLPRRHSH